MKKRGTFSSVDCDLEWINGGLRRKRTWGSTSSALQRARSVKQNRISLGVTWESWARAHIDKHLAPAKHWVRYPFAFSEHFALISVLRVGIFQLTGHAIAWVIELVLELAWSFLDLPTLFSVFLASFDHPHACSCQFFGFMPQESPNETPNCEYFSRFHLMNLFDSHWVKHTL